METSVIFSLVIAAVAVCVVIIVLLQFTGNKNEESSEGKSSKKRTKPNKTQSQIIKDATRRLAKNPDDPTGLQEIGEVYFKSELWDKALETYMSLDRIAELHPDKVKPEVVKLRAGICSYNTGKYQEAIVFLHQASKINSNSFEINYYLGASFYKDDQPDKALLGLKKALVVNPDSKEVNFLVSLSLYKTGHYKDSLPYFRKVYTEDPTNKEALFYYAEAMAEEGLGDKAIKRFMHLRSDPVYGAKSCLRIGIYQYNQGEKANAAQNFLIGLKHANIPEDVALETKYRLALCYFDMNNFSNGLTLLHQIRAVDENYKDIKALISRYHELSQNNNLQIYLSGGSTDFLNLCKKIVNVTFKDANIKIQNTNIGSAFTDILAEVNTPRYSSVELFRFFRTTGSTGELYVREFYDTIHDQKIDHGFCVTAGLFSDEAHRCIEGRPVDLVEKLKLTKLLKGITL